MGPLIALILVLVGVDWFRERLGLTWEQFGYLAIGVPLGCGILWFLLWLLRDRNAGQLPGDLPEGPTLMIGYQDADGHRTQRLITVRQVTVVHRGRLLLPARLEAYCHIVRDRRTFRLDRIEAASAFGQPIGNLHDWLMASCAAQPGLLVRDDLMWTPDLLLPTKPDLVPIEPFDVLVPGGRTNGEDLVVTAQGLIVTRAGSVVAIDGIAQQPRRRRVIRLHQVTDIAEAETGELIQTDPQVWLRAGRIGVELPDADTAPVTSADRREPAVTAAPDKITQPSPPPRRYARSGAIFIGLLLAALGSAIAFGVFGALSGQPEPFQTVAAPPAPQPAVTPSDQPPQAPTASAAPTAQVSTPQPESEPPVSWPPVSWPTDQDAAVWLQRIAPDIEDVGQVETLALKCGRWPKASGSRLDQVIAAGRKPLDAEDNRYIQTLLQAGAEKALSAYAANRVESCAALTPAALATLNDLAFGRHPLWRWPDGTP